MSVYPFVLCGDLGVGKTTMIMQLWPGRLGTEVLDPLIEDSYRKSVVLDGEPVLLDILDAYPNDAVPESRIGFLNQSRGLMLVYSITNRTSFENLEKHRAINSIQDAAIPYPILVVGNKADNVRDRTVSFQEGVEFGLQIGASYIETSALPDTLFNIPEAFLTMARLIRNINGPPVPNPNGGTAMRRCTLM